MVTREGNGLSRESLDGDILFFFFLIYWVTMVNKIIKVSNVQFYSVSSAQCRADCPTSNLHPSPHV